MLFDLYAIIPRRPMANDMALTEKAKEFVRVSYPRFTIVQIAEKFGCRTDEVEEYVLEDILQRYSRQARTGSSLKANKMRNDRLKIRRKLISASEKAARAKTYLRKKPPCASKTKQTVEKRRQLSTVDQSKYAADHQCGKEIFLLIHSEKRTYSGEFLGHRGKINWFVRSNIVSQPKIQELRAQ